VKANQLLVRVAEQRLYVLDENAHVIHQYPISTSKHGIGAGDGSNQTPPGKHAVREKIGDHCSEREVFIGRQAQGELEQLREAGVSLPEDVITARILWLEGLESGVNQGDGVDSYRRYIYIHGTNEENKIGTPASHGCIRMRNRDVMELYDMVDLNCMVIIEP
jgi:lipoprotein-anchoring transpeptidase ErfK/SrfK